MKKSGVASAEFLAREGAAVRATDLKPLDELPGVRELGHPVRAADARGFRRLPT